MPAISVFTPTHDVTYLKQAWRSLKDQTFKDWEWVVQLDGQVDSSHITWLPANDSRVTIHPHNGPVTVEGSGVGRAKQAAVAQCTGQVLVELDHDDELFPTCLEEIVGAFEKTPGAGMVYSRFTQIGRDGSPDRSRFGEDFGWIYDEADGFYVPRNLAPTPHNLSLIWYAPNHVRAFTRDAYDRAGGYDPELKVLDDLDLMARLHQVGPFVQIDRCLYRQRVHDGNTQKDPELNAHIQDFTWELYERYYLDNLRVWSSRAGLQGAESLADAPFILPATQAARYGYIRSYGELSPLVDISAVMEACHTLLAPNGALLIMAREYSYLNEHYFRAWASSDQAPFQISRLRTFEHEGTKWVQANLIAVKEGYVRDGGILHAKL